MTARAKRPPKENRALSARYLAALRTHLLAPKSVNGDHAHGVGRAAVLRGIEPRELAVMHETALVNLASSFDFVSAGNGTLARAGHFLSEALIPLDVAQRATRETNRLLQQRNETLRLHASSLARANRRLATEVARRKAGEEVVRKGKQQYQKLFIESQVMEKKLRLVTRQIIAAQEAERKEISRELHDEVVQTLVGINVQLSALCQGTSIGLHTLKAKIVGTQRLVENSVTAVHRFARGLRPAVLDDLGLIPALHAYCKSLSAQKKIKIQLTAFRSLETLNSNGRTVLYRVAQEALTNVARHAQATHVTVAITELGKNVRMEIADNGKSFSVEKTLFAKNNKRLGLIGMKERIEMIGGALTIISSPGAGTTVRADVPFNREKS